MKNANESTCSFLQRISSKKKLLEHKKKWGLRAQEPFKGVKELINQDRIAEPLEKGLVRQNFGLDSFQRWNCKI